MQMDSLKITGLSKTYGNGVKALDQVSLDIPVGMYGLLGPNGAGKSTLMRTLATLQEPDTGQIQLGDLNVLEEKDSLRQMLGYLPQEFGLYPRISAEALLDHLAVLKGLIYKRERKIRVEALLYKTNLYQDRKKKLGGFSGGMKQRFGIAQALLSNPKLIIVDEPTAGLDPAERNRFYNLLSELGEQAIVILSTHLVEDVRELCSQMAIIHQGQVKLQGNPQQLMNGIQGRVWKKVISKAALPDYQQAFRVISDRLFQGTPIVHIWSESDPGNGFEPVQAGLEDVYFNQLNS